MTTPLAMADKRRLLRAQLLRKEGFASEGPQRIPRRAGTGPAPLSFGQQRLWFLHRLDPQSPAYNLTEAVRLSGDLDERALEHALAKVVHRHQVLRTVFPETGGLPAQVVLPPQRTGLPQADLSALPEPARAAETARVSAELRRKPFDLTRGPLFAPALLRLEPTEHLLVLSMHHTVTDGWSMTLLVSELTALYAAFSAGLPSPLLELPIQYADFAEWQRSHLQGETLESHLRFWKERLADAPALLELPTDRPRPAVQTFHGHREPVWVPAATAAALRELARSQGATLFMAVTAVLGALLFRSTGQEDLLLGTPVANRNRPEIEELIGFFVNTLVLRLDLSGDPDFARLLSRVRTTAMEADAHQDLPFEKLVDALNLPRDLSRNPLFQVMLTFQNLPPASGERPSGLSITPYGLEARTAQMDLHFLLAEGPHGIVGQLEYRTDLFDAPTAQRLARHFEALLAAVARDPSLPLSELPLLSPPEVQQILREWNDTRTGDLAGACLHELIAAQAERTPGAPAVTFEGETLTCAELDRRALLLASRLRTLGCGPETRVGVAMERSLELVVALLATLQAGAAYVPLDPDYPRERLAFMLEDSRPAVLLTQERLRPQLPVSNATVLCLEPEMPGPVGLEAPAPNRWDEQDERQLAYVIYTSGSTGRPKGAMVHHRAIVNRLVWMQEAYGLTAADAVLQKTPFSFDVSVWEFFWPLLAGARLVLAKPGGHRDPAYLAGLVRHEGVTVLHFVPSMLQAFLAEPDLSACGSLRLVVASGEALPAELARRCSERLQRAQLENLYGPTEAAVDVTRWSCNSGGAPVPIGRPIANTRIHLVDQAGRPVPIGAAGELWIGGVNVGRGYLHRPDLTAERFVPDPFARELAAEPGGRLYRTGDLARQRADGAIEYLGRIDHQVKVRGFRIEMGEIESALAAHPAVREAAVAAPEAAAGRRLAAYVVLRPGEEVSLGDLRGHLGERLPEHMVPALFVFLNALPLSPNGKLDRRALPAPDAAAALAGAEHAAPETPNEMALVEVWEEVLGVGRVGALDNFFALGGDSILSLQVVARARKHGLDLTLQKIFQHQTVRELARRAGPVGDSATVIAPFELASAEDRALLPGGVEDAYPLARLQAGMLFHSQLDPDGSVYHDIFSDLLRGPFDEGALHRAITRATARHPVLRTSFALIGFGEPLQLVHTEVPAPLELEDLRHLAPERQREAVDAWLEAERHRGFDPLRPPLLRFHVDRLGEDTFQFTMSFHHAILDGWSAAVVRTELFRTYMALVQGSPGAEVPEQAPDTCFRDFVWLERQALASAEMQEFWLRHLEGATATRLPRWPLPPVASPRGYDRFVAVSPEVLSGLRRVSRDHGVPIKSLLCAAHLRVAALVSGERDVVIGMVVNGRPEQEGTGEAVGLFLNTLPFRMRLGDESWAGLARAAFELERAMLPHRRFPLAEILAAHGGQPLFEMVFGFTQFHVYREIREVEGLAAFGSYGYEETNFPLGVNFDLGADGSRLVVRLNFSDAEVAPEQVRVLGSWFERALAALAAEPDGPHAQASLLGEAERRQLLQGWSDGGPAAAPRTSAARLFEERALEAPQALAVVADGARLTYGELDRRANQLARLLRTRGARPDAPVAVCLDRSPGLLVALLAAWKTGSPYLPLDPAYPIERLAFMLEDSRSAVLLTEEQLTAGLPLQIERLPLVRLDVDGPLLDEQPGDPLPDGAGPEDLAYVIYTSGSTGTPKGVMVPHGGLGNLAAAQGKVFDVRPGDRVLQFASLSFDAAISEILMALLRGAELHVAVAPRLMPGPDLLELLAERRITHLTLPPSVLAALPEADLPDLRVLVVAGEACPPELARRWAGGPAGRRLVDAYGPTEATVCATAGELTADGGKPLIGRPLAGARVLVLDRGLEPSPACTPGEIFLGGSGLARGYLGRPALTAERFVPDPFCALAGTPGARLYRTGDLGRWLFNGTLDFLGRADQQVKIRGFRVEPGEVEAALARHPAVREAVVAAYDANGDPRLGAWVVPREGTSEEEAAALPGELRAALRAALPEHMVPSAIVPLDALPLTPNGKLDRRRLPHPDTLQPDRVAGYVAPRTDTERRLAGIWAEVLGIERVGLHDSFLELGGHSLLAMRLILRVRSELGIDLPLRLLYGANTLADMAKAVANAEAEGIDDALHGGARFVRRTPEIPQIPQGLVDRSAPVPPTDFQEALWISRSGLFDLGGCGTNVYIEYEFSGAVWPFAASLENALRQVIARHEMLRTIIRPDGRLQLLAEVPPYEVEVEDLSSRSAERIEEHLRKVREEMRYARRPGDRWPLFDIVLHQVGDGKIRLHARFDMILLDGGARGILVQELVQLLSFPERPLPSLEVTFLDFARALAAFRESATYAQSRAYWMERLPSLPPPPVLPLARPLAPEDIPRIVKREPELLDEEAWRALCTRASRAGLSPTGAVTAAFVEVLRLWSASPDFTLGFGGSYRPPVHSQIDRVVGSFTTIHLLAVEDGPGTFRERAQRLQERMTADLDHQEFTGHQVLRELNRRRGMGARSSLPIQLNSIVTQASGAGAREPVPAAPEGAGGTEGAPRPVDMTEIDLLATLPQVLLLWVVLENEQGGFTLVSQGVEEAFPEGLVTELIVSYQDLLARLAADEAAWNEDRPARRSTDGPPPAADGPPIPALGYGAHPGFVESALQRHPSLREARVAWCAEGEGRGRLIAWVVARTDRQPDDGELRSHLHALLPAHLIPDAFVRLEALPRTAAGDIDRVALPVPPEPPARAAASWDEVEVALADLWEELLGQRPESSRDDFFASGGDSLLAVRLLAKIARRWSHEVPVADLFARPTLEGVARVVRESTPSPSALRRLGGWLRGTLSPKAGRSGL